MKAPRKERPPTLHFEVVPLEVVAKLVESSPRGSEPGARVAAAPKTARVKKGVKRG